MFVLAGELLGHVVTPGPPLYFPCPIPEMSHFSKKALILLVDNSI